VPNAPIGGTPEAFFTTPFGDINFPTWFVEALGPSYFEPSLFLSLCRLRRCPPQSSRGWLARWPRYYRDYGDAAQ
jgi:hypothetical protein